jgi:hypothetical protein
MSMAEVGTTGSSRQSWDDYSPRPLLERLMREYKGKLSLPKAREEIIEQFVEDRFEGVTFADDDQRLYLEAIVKYWVHNNYNSLLAILTKSRQTSVVQAQANAEMLTKAKKAAVSMVWFGYVMPNGKKLADCTGDDLAGMRALLDHNLAKLIGAIKPKQQVKAVFDRNQLQEFLG